jgi:hypothetical protein|tara:strand:- start:29123 stop:29584 length:462 start_codon:yes stop_codon:yes gene_type:complete
MGFAQRARQMVNAINEKEYDIWNTFLKYSTEYEEILKLKESDMETLEDNQYFKSIYPDLEEIASKGFLKASVYNEEFALTVKYVRVGKHGERWTKKQYPVKHHCIFAICTSNPSMNKSIGRGTTLISVLPKAWHERLIEGLKKDGMEDSLVVN